MTSCVTAQHGFCVLFSLFKKQESKCVLAAGQKLMISFFKDEEEMSEVCCIEDRCGDGRWSLL